MKKTIVAILFMCGVTLLHAQIIGSRENGEASPSEVKASDLSMGNGNGDVDLFSGTYNYNYSFGSVSTPSGLSYGVNLSYSSVASGGNTPPHMSGIPYGEGWSVAVPSISITTENYQDTQRVAGTSIKDFRPSNANSNLAQEGELYWHTPMLSIPGVASDKLVYKGNEIVHEHGTTKTEAVFVLNSFEQYIEAFFDGGRWKVVLSDGTTYEFSAAKKGVRSPINQRVELESDMATYDATSDVKDIQKQLLLPKTEILSWYLTRIYNPNYPKNQEIHLRYNTYGAFQYFREYSQLSLQSTIKRELYANLSLEDVNTIPWLYKDE